MIVYGSYLALGLSSRALKRSVSINIDCEELVSSGTVSYALSRASTALSGELPLSLCVPLVALVIVVSEEWTEELPPSDTLYQQVIH